MPKYLITQTYWCNVVVDAPTEDKAFSIAGEVVRDPSGFEFDEGRAKIISEEDAKSHAEDSEWHRHNRHKFPYTETE